ncbi:sensor domain-containing phosphodiesterase [Qipengyuania sphaerica]|uniref:sensor domain-containing phosphodiesterase n=1 Tax=Qipengyuania sphaerica TaxID=2867243 RepID=UPI001C880BB5|nr:EAL domain-containing protein [Qipengyuania sphaerica]MBX7540788.1 EAL domain-containing protein [Qipengyuania sphaerica]
MSQHRTLVPAVASKLAAEPVQTASIDRILRAVREHLGTEIAFVSRYVENNEKELTHVDSDLDLPMGPGFRDPRENSYCWHIAEGRLPELIQDPADHPFTATMAITDFLPVGCHLNTPLRLSDGTLYGSFCCLSRNPDRTMTERDVGVLRAFAALAVEQIESNLDHDYRFQRIDKRITKLIGDRAMQIHQQPIHSIKTGKPVGVECLARFPDAMMRGPDKWFEEAAEIGRGLELELLAVECALDSLKHVPSGFYVSVNASPETIISGALHQVLERAGKKNLVVEVTEHQQVDDYPALKKALKPISKYARIAIDDVGSGYAGLRHLVDLAPDMLKLDMALTRDIHQDLARCALVGAMVRFAEAIGSKLIAEGVEHAEEAEVLKKLGVEYGQGFYYAKPMPVADAVKYLKKG